MKNTQDFVKNAKRKAFKRGLNGERKAALWLQLKGFHIAARRFKTRHGEIDLIARRGRLVAIVEVKARRSLAEAMEAVNTMSAHRIEQACDIWLARQADHDQLYVRFDLIAIMPYRLPKHIPNIFQTKIKN
ncbi:YraN family protein [Bartonella tamiae]|uniref:UPF0102 protein ME5_00789 n=1 Tax=Bartonella tamiae Th239 TaxID=1094558 RepID=J0ZP78_9HYPH|nr:YraN family protein [Bartonella tamiae]EJF90388.1 TIGR00252 family protein [Bartonella tamiae Th239]EJF93668.1 TIGR00252 family protein [Bartonella tamiae Th307]